MTAPRLLTRGLLDELGRCWQERSLPLLQQLQPGLSHDQIESVVAPLGIRLPREVREWWQWHDGTRPGPRGRRLIGARGWEYLSLAQAVRLYSYQSQMAAELAELAGEDVPPLGEKEYYWHPSWFPLTNSDVGGEVLALDCSVAEDAPCPVRLVSWDGGDFHAVLAGSLGDVIAEWIDAFDSGRWRWVPREARWEREIVPGCEVS